MAMHKIPSPIYALPGAVYDPGEVQVTEYAIGGKLISVNMSIQNHDAVVFKTDEEFRQEIKRQLVSKWAEYCIDKHFIEVTYLNDPSDFAIRLRAHGYLAPNDQVKIVRQMQLPSVKK